MALVIRYGVTGTVLFILLEERLFIAVENVFFIVGFSIARRI